MPSNLERFKMYFNEQILPCSRCSSDSSIGSFLSYEKLPPYGVNGEARILIIGHSPKVRTNSQPKIAITFGIA